MFTPEQINGSSRKEELFKKFIGLVHNNCTQQRDVAWYANELCISSRYLASIVREITKQGTDRKSVVWGKSVLVQEGTGGRRY